MTFDVVPSVKVVQLRSVNYRDRFVRHRSFLGELTPLASELDQKDASFIIRPGLAGKGVSFEPVNYPGYFLRHQGFALKLHKRESSDLFKADATFMERRGLAGSGTSFESVNFPRHFLRHCSFKLFLDNNNRNNGACDKNDGVFKSDVSFDVVDAP